MIKTRKPDYVTLSERFPQCDYVYLRGVKRGTQCVDPGNYDGRCCKHKYKNKDNNLPLSILKNLSLDDDLHDDPKIRAKENTERLKSDDILGDQIQSQDTHDNQKTSSSSIWNFTINTNTNYDSMTNEDKKRFKRFMNYVFSEEGILSFLTDIDNPNDPTANLDEPVKTDYYYENSSKNLLHSHGIIRLVHHGRYKLRYNDIRDIAKVMFGKAIHFNAQVHSDGPDPWEEYMKKCGIAGKITL